MPLIVSIDRIVLRLDNRDRGTIFPSNGRKLVIEALEPGGLSGHGAGTSPEDMGIIRTVCWLEGGTGGGKPNLLRRWIPIG
jgi:hypothetical protein